MLLRWTVWGSVAVLSFGLYGLAEGAEGKIKGVAFGDYYFVATGANKNENGFKFRRIYMTYDLKWNDRWSGRVRYEANDSGFGGEAAATPGALAPSSVPGSPARRNFDSLSCWHTNVTLAVYIDL